MPSDLCYPIAFVTMHVRQSPQAVPLAAATISAALPPIYSRQTHLIDAFVGETDDKILAKIVQIKPRLVAFSLYVWNRQRLLQLCQRLREQNPTLVLVAGGPEATACCQELRDSGLFDAVIAGEGEKPFAQLVAILAQNHPIGKAENAAPQPLDLDRQRSPWLSGVLAPGHGVLWETSRGCPFQCAFCYDARGSRGVRTIPVARLQQELQLFARQGVAQVWVLDSTFNYPPQRGKSLLRLIARYAPHIHFHLEAKAEFLDEETVMLLQRIQCSVQVGLQSARPEVLKQIQRPLDVQQFGEKVALLSAAGITFGIDLIYGLPGDDDNGLRASLDFALSCAPNHVEVFPLALLPGTRLYEQRQLYALEALPHPPYTVTASATMSHQQFCRCQKIAAATDLFYNTGRSMAYFMPLCQSCQMAAADFLERFADWVMVENKLDSSQFCLQQWSPQHACELQLAFVAQLFTELRCQDLIAVCQNLIRFHRDWADALLAEELLPGVDDSKGMTVLDRAWQLSPALRLDRFEYAVDELSALTEIDLIELAEILPPCPSTGVFFRRGSEVFCESIDEVLAALLEQSRGCQTARQILTPFSEVMTPAECLELVTFAAGEGLLVATQS